MKNKMFLSLVIVSLVLLAVSSDAAKKKPALSTPTTAAPAKAVVSPAVPVVLPTPPAPPAPVESVKRIPIEIGYGGGAALVDIGYLFPLSGRPITLKVDAGFALGNAYNIILVQGQAEYAFNPTYFGGLSIDYANYSQPVANIPGVSGTIAKGANTGGGIFLGKNMDKYFAKIGYSTVLGLTASIGSKF
jgi:hypothetical protein